MDLGLKGVKKRKSLGTTVVDLYFGVMDFECLQTADSWHIQIKASIRHSPEATRK